MALLVGSAKAKASNSNEVNVEFKEIIDIAGSVEGQPFVTKESFAIFTLNVVH